MSKEKETLQDNDKTVVTPPSNNPFETITAEGDIDLFGKDPIEPTKPEPKGEEGESGEEGGEGSEDTTKPDPTAFDIFGDRDDALLGGGQEIEEEEEDEGEEGEGIASEGETGEEEGEESTTAEVYLSKQLKADGWLPEDFEVTDETSLVEAYNAMVDGMREGSAEQIRREVYDELVNLGYNERDLQYAKLIRSGIDLNTLSRANSYEVLGQVDIEKASASELKDVVSAYYQDRNWKDKEIEDRISDLEVEDGLKEVGKEATAYFQTKGKELIEAKQKEADDNQKAYDARIKQQTKRVNEILSKGEVFGDKISNINDFKKGIYEQNKTIEVQGQKYTVSELQAFLQDWKSDPGVQLWAFNKWRNKDKDKSELKQEVKAEVEKSFLEDYKKVTSSKKSKTVTRKAKDALNKANSRRRQPPSSTGKSIFKKENQGPIVYDVSGGQMKRN